MNQGNKIKYLTNLTRKKVEITTSIQYDISKNSSMNGGQTDQFFRYAFAHVLNNILSDSCNLLKKLIFLL